MKRNLIAGLAVILVAATAFSIYNVVTAQGNGQDNGQAAANSGAPVRQTNGASGSQATLNGAGAGQGQAGPAQGQQGQTQAQQNQAGQELSQAAGAGQQGGPGMGQAGRRQAQPGGRSQGQAGQTGTGNAVPAPQNGIAEWVSLAGSVQGYAAPGFTLVTAGGQEIPVQLGSSNYVNQIGLTLADGQQVTLVGGYEPTGDLAVQSITVDGQTYTLRNATGRPMWAGRGRQ